MAKSEIVSFEDALDRTGFGKFNFLMFLLNFGLIMGMAFEIFSVAYLVPASACELHTTNAQQGLMAAMPMVGIIATSHFWGYLADTRGRRKILCLSLFMAFGTGFIAAWSPNWIVFSILKFFSSSAVAGTYALALTLVSECTPQAKRAMMIALTTTIFLTSTGIMGVLSIPILPLKFSYYIPFLNIHFNSWRLLNIIYVLPCAIGASGLILAYESPKYLLSIGEEEKALKVLRDIFVINTGKPAEDFQVTSITLDEESSSKNLGFWASMVAQTVPLLKPPLLKHTVILSMLFIIVYFCLNPFMVWLPYLADGFMRSMDSGAEGLTFCEMIRFSQNATVSKQSENCVLDQFAMAMVFSVSIFLATLNTIYSIIINFYGRKRTLITIQLLSGLTGVCVNLSNIWALNVCLFILFLSGVLNFGFLSAFSVDIFPTYVKAMAVCLTLMLGRGSSVLGINLLKSLIDTSCETSFYLFGGLTVFGGLLAFLLPQDDKIADKKAVEAKETF